MSRREALPVLLMGICCGGMLSLAYINPYSGSITLSELILQLSGSRGEFPLDFTVTELLSFSARLIPYLLMELYGGTGLYRSFCTASVYVFSRTSNRIRWYIGECLKMAGLILLYQAALTVSAAAAACSRYDVIWEKPGFVLLGVHLLLYGLWTFSMTLLVNILAILLGSSGAFAAAAAGQLAMVSGMAPLNLLENRKALFSVLIQVNPLSHLVLGWQFTACAPLDHVIHPPWKVLPLSGSILYMTAIAAGVLFIGGWIVRGYDLLAADPEFGGI